MDESYNDKIQAYKDSLPLLQDLVPGLGPEKNGERHGGCPSCGSTAGSDRFWVSTTGKYAGKCKCRMDDCAFYKGADIIDYIEITTGADLTTQMREAGFLDDEPAKLRRVKPVKEGSGAAQTEEHPEKTPDLSLAPPAAKKNTASFIWDKSKASGKIPYEYFEKTRKLKLEQNTEIRFNSYTDKEKILHEMIVLRLSRPGDDLAEPQSIQRIFIKKEDNPDSDDYGLWVKTGTAISNGTERAAVGRGVWFCPGMSMKEIAAGEGPETMISVGLATGMNHVSCLTDSGIKNIQFPKETEDVYFFVDQDCKLGKHGGPGFAGQKSGLTAARRAEKQGKRAFIVTPTEDTFSDDPEKIDFNDLWEADQTGQIIRDRLALAVPIGDIDWKPPRKKKREAGDGEYPEGTLELLEELNGEYAACRLSGKFRILTEETSYNVSAKGVTAVEFMEVGSWLQYEKPRKCKVWNGDRGLTKKVSLANEWLEWEGRRSYRSVVFDPKKTPEGAFNLFRGLPIKPVKGSWDKLKSHMFNILCNKNILHFDYLMAWMARPVQDPGGKRPGVAVVFVGGKGTGKGTLVREYGKLFGEYFSHISSTKGLLGDFNIHIARSIIVFGDEATWAKDHKNESVLKAMITEPLILFTPKGIDSMNMRSHVNLMMAANNRNAVPASFDERRFFVLECQAKDYADTNYFDEIHEELENGGTEAMMYELLHHKIDIDLSKAPKTEALAGQVEQNMSDTHEFWHNVMERGFLLSDSKNGSPYESSAGDGYWPKEVFKYELQFEYEKIFCKGKSYPDNINIFWKDTKIFWGYQEKKRRLEGKQLRAIVMLPLGDLKDKFTNVITVRFSRPDVTATERSEAF